MKKLFFAAAAFIVGAMPALGQNTIPATPLQPPVAVTVWSQPDYQGNKWDLQLSEYRIFIHAEVPGATAESIEVHSGYRMRFHMGLDGTGGMSQWFDAGKWPDLHKILGHTMDWHIGAHMSTDQWVAEIAAVGYDQSALGVVWGSKDDADETFCMMPPGTFPSPWVESYLCFLSGEKVGSAGGKDTKDTARVRVPANYVLTLADDSGHSVDLEGGWTPDQDGDGKPEPWVQYQLEDFGWKDRAEQYSLLPDNIQLINVSYDYSNAVFQAADASTLDTAKATNSSTVVSAHEVSVEATVEETESWSYQTDNSSSMMIGVSATESVEADEGFLGSGAKEGLSLEESAQYQSTTTTSVGDSGSTSKPITHSAEVEVELEPGDCVQVSLQATRRQESGVVAVRTWQNLRTGDTFQDTGQLSSVDAFDVNSIVESCSTDPSQDVSYNVGDTLEQGGEGKPGGKAKLALATVTCPHGEIINDKGDAVCLDFQHGGEGGGGVEGGEADEMDSSEADEMEAPEPGEMSDDDEEENKDDSAIEGGAGEVASVAFPASEGANAPSGSITFNGPPAVAGVACQPPGVLVEHEGTLGCAAPGHIPDGATVLSVGQSTCQGAPGTPDWNECVSDIDCAVGHFDASVGGCVADSVVGMQTSDLDCPSGQVAVQLRSVHEVECSPVPTCDQGLVASWDMNDSAWSCIAPLAVSDQLVCAGDQCGYLPDDAVGGQVCTPPEVEIWVAGMQLCGNPTPTVDAPVPNCIYSELGNAMEAGILGGTAITVGTGCQVDADVPILPCGPDGKPQDGAEGCFSCQGDGVPVQVDGQWGCALPAPAVGDDASDRTPEHFACPGEEQPFRTASGGMLCGVLVDVPPNVPGAAPPDDCANNDECSEGGGQ